MLVKCGCGDKNCKTGLRFEDAHHLWLIDKDGKESLMYLNKRVVSDINDEIEDTWDLLVDEDEEDKFNYEQFSTIA